MNSMFLQLVSDVLPVTLDGHVVGLEGILVFVESIFLTNNFHRPILCIGDLDKLNMVFYFRLQQIFDAASKILLNQ